MSDCENCRYEQDKADREAAKRRRDEAEMKYFMSQMQTQGVDESYCVYDKFVPGVGNVHYVIYGGQPYIAKDDVGRIMVVSEGLLNRVPPKWTVEVATHLGTRQRAMSSVFIGNAGIEWLLEKIWTDEADSGATILKRQVIIPVLNEIKADIMKQVEKPGLWNRVKSFLGM